MMKPPDKKISPLQGPRPTPGTANGRGAVVRPTHQGFRQPPDRGTARSDIDALAQIAARLAEAVAYFNGDAPDPEAA